MALVAGLALTGFSAVPAQAAPGVLFAFGDSVAAGEGSSAGSFNEGLAADLGYQVHNFAQTGASAADVGTQLAQAVGLTAATGTQPTMITVMVGANDIHYGECLLALVGVGPGTECGPAAVSANLGTMAGALGASLFAIRQAYPAAQLTVVGYYNPMPKPAKTNSQICPVMKTMYQASLAGDQEDFISQATNPDLTLVKAFQAGIHSSVQQVLTPLNQTIAAVAAGVGAPMVPLNFTNHDFCADYAKKSPAWVLAPEVTSSGSIDLPGGPVSLDSLARPRHLCTGGVLCPTQPILVFPVESPYQVSVDVNDFPHLTARGNAAVADTIQAYLGLAD